ncbi:G2/mitotic-specific cyclin [Paramarasmius palmivorus]|uniref:G2/mitotic-specific cyclin n=1 Tax=Paramarasmius palmivorus TaxID=297713 RepID=A0AAW0CTC5_9AGAR
MNKDTENANARPSRITTRAKAQASATDGPITRSAATTFASRAKAVEPQPTEKTAGKRKREVLAEVTEVNKGKKAAGSAKGKEKEKADDSKNSATTSTRVLRTTTTAKAGSRQPLRKVLTRSAKKETTQAQASASTEESARSLLSADLPVFHIVPREGNGKAGTSAPLASITEDDTERPRVFKKRHTEPEPPSEDPSAMPVSEDMPPAHVDSSRLDEEHIATQLAAAEEDDDTGLWDDLDAEDMDDPYMVAEYIHEITAYLKEREQKTLPVADYMRFHAELSWDAREILLDWIVQIHARYNFLPESFFLTVNLFDRFLSLRPTISLQKLQLVGVSCFCVAVKFEEGVSPSVQELVRLTGETYTSEEICKAERYVLKTIGYDLSSPGPMTWLRRGSKADNLEPQARTIAKYLLEVASFLKDLVATPPSLLAAASLWFARLMLGREDWNANLVHYTTYKEREIVPIANAMLNYVLGEGQSETLYRKYASKKYMKCSVFVRKWALSRFAGGAEVDLVEMLPVIKADIVEARIAKLTAEAEEADAD